MTATEQLIARIMEIDEARAHLDGELGALMDERARLEASALEILLTDHPGGQFSIKFNGRTASVRRDVYAKFRPGMGRAQVIAALKNSEFADIVQENYNANTLSALVREHDKNGEPLPEVLAGVVEPSEKFSIRTTKAV